MSDTNDLIDLLSQNDRKTFINSLQLNKSSKDSVSQRMFKAYLKGNLNVLKRDMGSNSFHVSKKRLNDKLIEFIAQQIFELEVLEENNLIKHLLIARKLFLFNKARLAFKLLERAKKQAIKLKLYSILNEIYHTLIENSHLKEAPNQEQLIREFQENLEQHSLSEQRNMANAKIRKAFIRAEFEGQEVELMKEFEAYKNVLTNSPTYQYEFKDLLYVAEIADSEGSYTKNYAEVNLFFIEHLKEIQGSEIDNEQQLPYHIELLYLISNIYFRKKDFNESQVFLAKMHKQMLRFDQKYFNTYRLKYFNLLSLNCNFTGDYQKAEKLLDQLIHQEKHPKVDLLNHILIRITIHFQQAELKKAIQLFAQLQESDSWYEQRMGKDWLLNKKYIEILLHIELNNLDYVDSKIQSLTRKYKDYFKSKESFQLIPFLKLVKEVYRYPDIASQSDFMQLVDEKINRKPAAQEDLFLMCFYAWLKAKMLRSPLYETTLDLIASE